MKWQTCIAALDHALNSSLAVGMPDQMYLELEICKNNLLELMREFEDRYLIERKTHC